MALNDYTFGDLYLKASAWFVSHKYFFRKWWVILILSLNLMMIIYILVNGLIFTFERSKYNQLASGMTADFISGSYRQKAQPEEIEVVSIRAIGLGSGNYDLTAKIKNPNEDWGVSSFSYKFIIKEQETKPAESYLLPGEEKYLFSQNFFVPEGLEQKDVKFEISGLNWQRLTDKTVFNGLDFAVEDQKLTNTVSSAGGATLLTAKITNRSFYDFWKVDVPIVLLFSGEPVAVSHYTIRTFTSYQSEDISVSWLKALPLGAEIKISPSVNIFEASNFMTR